MPNRTNEKCMNDRAKLNCSGMRMAGPTLFKKNSNDQDHPATGKRSGIIIAALAAALFLAGAEGRADIYRYVDETGAECFTDTPEKKGATRIMKDQGGSRHPASNGKALRTPPASGLGKSGAPLTSEPANRFTAAVLLPIRGTITSPVGLRQDPIDGLLRHHNGVDIAVPEGTPVKPVAPGIVTFSGFRAGHGNSVIIAHDDGMITLYAHNSANLMREGERVATGSTIALSGSTGRSTGPHLHFEAWKDGSNMTMAFASGMPVEGPAISAMHRRDGGIRRIVQTDGSLLFTNLR
jgi:murein DD-endopeptidase MepM/ murein hydrolase activator NlpD